MATDLKSQQDYYDDWKNAVQAIAPQLTDFSDGSELDSLGGATSEAGNEFSLIVNTAFAKTFIETANGPEITGGPDDLQTLAVDHFGSTFARPGPVSSEGVVTFTRPNAGAGNVTIPAGTVVKTSQDANGVSHRFSTVLAVLMTGTTINASAESIVEGASEDVLAHTVNIIESALTDVSITVDNPSPMVGGADTLDDSAYREYIYDLIAAVRGATLEAIQAKAKTVPGVVSSLALETEMSVIGWNIATSTTVGSFFYIPFAALYVADANGSADQALINAVQVAIDSVRAAGVKVTVYGASPDTLDWASSLTFNPTGPSFASLSVDPTPILTSMKDYINSLAIGTGFIRSVANAAIMSIWGPGGTNDLTNFVTVDPVGDVSATPTTKIVAGNMTVV
jgi:hypothetical protein